MLVLALEFSRGWTAHTGPTAKHAADQARTGERSYPAPKRSRHGITGRIPEGSLPQNGRDERPAPTAGTSNREKRASTYP